MNLDPYIRKLTALRGALDRAQRAVFLPDQTSEEVERREAYALFRAKRLADHEGAPHDVSGRHRIMVGLKVVRGPFTGVVVAVRGEESDIQLDGCNEVQTVRSQSITVLE